MSTDLVIAQLNTALLALGQAKTIQDTKQIVDMASAAEVYAKRQKMSDESIAFAYDVKVEALRQLGVFLAVAPKNDGARAVGKSGVPNRNPTLADHGLDKKTSMLAQRLASMPEATFKQVKAGDITLSKAIAAPKASAQNPKSSAQSVAGTTPASSSDALAPDDHGMSDEESAAAEEYIARETAHLAEICAGDDALGAMTRKCKELTQMNAVLTSRVTGLQNELLAMTRSAKSWMRKAKANGHDRVTV